MDIITAGTGNTSDYDLIILAVFLFWLLIAAILYSVSKLRTMRQEALHRAEHHNEAAESEQVNFDESDSVHTTV